MVLPCTQRHASMGQLGKGNTCEHVTCVSVYVRQLVMQTWLCLRAISWCVVGVWVGVKKTHLNKGDKNPKIKKVKAQTLKGGTLEKITHCTVGQETWRPNNIGGFWGFSCNWRLFWSPILIGRIVVLSRIAWEVDFFRNVWYSFCASLRLTMCIFGWLRECVRSQCSTFLKDTLHLVH